MQTGTICALVIIASITILAHTQSPPYWANPVSGIQVTTLNLIINGLRSPSPKLTHVTFNRIFYNTPNVVMTLGSIQNLEQDKTIFQLATSIATTSFIHKLLIFDPNESINTLKVIFCAVDLIKFSYFYPHTMVVQLTRLSSSYNQFLTTQYIPVQYLNPLVPGRQYQLVVMITGFQCMSDSTYLIGVQGEKSNQNQFILRVRAENAMLIRIQIVRTLVDRYLDSAQNLTLHTLGVGSSSIQFFQDSTYRYDPYYVPGSGFIFFGIMQFQHQFECDQGGSIFKAPQTPQKIKTGYTAFKEYKCPDTAMWQMSTSSCYYPSSMRIYRINAQYCQHCFMACYRCTGPLYQDCVEILDKEAINNTVDRKIECRPNYATNQITYRCMPCQQFVNGCNSCLPNGTCLSCIPQCNYTNQTYCNCTQTCLSQLEYVDRNTGECLCLPQYYRLPNNSCALCVQTCYICRTESYICDACINGYQLEGSNCVNYIYSSYLIDGNIGTATTMSRCLAYSGSTCTSQCGPASYMFQTACYTYECPSRFFHYTEVHTNSRMCQPCPSNCKDCDNYFTCKKCLDSSFYLTEAGQCKQCTPGCSSCLQGDCFACGIGFTFNNYTNLCDEDLPESEGLPCSLGCQQCVTIQYCEICSQGYFRYRNETQCTNCTQQGMRIVKRFISGILTLSCQQICGDGLVLSTQCDDGNLFDGDGCNNQCQIERDFYCQIFDNKSFCMKSGYDFKCSYQRNFIANEINITIKWQAGSPILFEYKCQPNLTVTKTTQYSNSTVYTVTYPQSAHHKTCNFTLPNSSIIPQTLTCNITTFPLALQTLTNSTISTTANWLFNMIAKPAAISMWVLCGLGIDPFDLLINYGFVYLYLVNLYDYDEQVPGMYAIFQEFSFYGFYVGIRQEGEHSFQGMFEALWKILAVQAIIIVFQQTVIRFLKTERFSATQIKIFINIFHNRFTLYLINYIIMLPISAFFIATLFKHMFNSLNKDDAIYLVVLLIHCMYFILVNVGFLMIWQRITQIKGHFKYMILIIWFELTAIAEAFSISNGSDRMFLGATIFTYIFLVFLYFAWLDDSPEIRQMALEEQYQQRVLEQTIRRLGKGAIYDQQNDDQQEESNQKKAQILHGWNYFKRLTRKINITLQLGCFITTCVLRFFYFLQEPLGKSGDTYGVLINSIFVYGMFCGGLGMSIFSQIITVVIYIKAEVPADQVKKKKIEDSDIMSEGIHQGSRANLKQMDMSEYSRQERLQDPKPKRKNDRI